MEIVRICLINDIEKMKGCEKAPNKILDSLKEIGSNEKGEIFDYKKLNQEEIHIDSNNLVEADYLIFQNSKEIIEKNFKSIFIGGDHSISYPILRALNKIEKNPLLILFDARVDSGVSNKIPNHKEWLRRLVEEGFNPGNIILVTTRNIFEEENEFLKENNIVIIRMEYIREDIDGVCDLIMERAINSSGFYVSIDINSIDPAFAPGCNDSQVGGLTSLEMIYFIKRLKLLKNFKGGDIVNINPLVDLNGMTVKLGARLIAEMI